MYAYTDNSYRAISEFDELAAGEQRSETIPASVLLALNAMQVRATRDNLLRVSDWTQMSDNNLLALERAAWAAYRQLLREVPQQAGFPDNILWPTAPTFSPDAVDGLPEQA